MQKNHPGENAPASSEMPLKVFISYSREDMRFADELVAGLEFDGGFEVSIDRHSIHEGEDWRARLGALIAGADTVVFILTPASASSPVCQWEVDEAVRLSKRILPVQAASLEGIVPPVALSSLNYVRFDGDSSFMAGLTGLRRALNTNLTWLREHTRLLARAREWSNAGEPESRLLFGGDIEAAKAWLAAQPREAPPPTGEHLAYIAASDRAEAERANADRRLANSLRTRLKLALVASVVAAMALAMGAFAYRQAISEGRRADRFYNLVSSNPAGARAMQRTCTEAIQVTAGLARVVDNQSFEVLERRFRELYFGPMYIVELHQRKKSGTDRSDIETSMVEFGGSLDAALAAKQARPLKNLCGRALRVRQACEAHLGFTAPPEPC